jgi:hypothetical protein
VIVIVFSTFVRRSVACACVAASSLLGPPAFAQAPQQPAPAAGTPQPADPQQIRQELDRLRQEFEAIRDSYGARLAALEAKLGAATPAPPAAPPPATAPPTAAAPPAVEAPAPAQPPAEVSGAPERAAAQTPQEPAPALPAYNQATSKVFNPDMAVIGNFLGAAGKNDAATTPALRLDEAEATFQAVVDPYARADFFMSFTPEGVEVEEGFLTLTSLPGGLLAKVGKMKEQFGKVNTLHPHSLSWTDRPLVMTNLLGGDEGMADSGISVSRLLINPLFFLEATGEVFAGTAGPLAAHDRGDVSWVGRLRGYRDITEGTNLDVGTSFAYGHNELGPSFRTRLFGVDATFRYRPLQRAIYKRFLGRTELIWSHREQPLFSGGDQSSFGYYASADYQFARRWFTGVRFDSSDRAADSALGDKGVSGVLTFWPSEFSQVRGQLRHTRYAEGITANELLFQFLFSIGAHGAHTF